MPRQDCKADAGDTAAEAHAEKRRARVETRAPKGVTLLQIAGCSDRTAEIGFDPLTQGKRSRDMERTYVRGPGGPNAIHSVMGEEAAAEAAAEVLGLADIAGVKVAVGGRFAEDVDAGPLLVVGPDGVELELVLLAGCAGPVDVRSQANGLSVGRDA